MAEAQGPEPPQEAEQLRMEPAEGLQARKEGEEGERQQAPAAAAEQRGAEMRNKGECEPL